MTRNDRRRKSAPAAATQMKEVNAGSGAGATVIVPLVMLAGMLVPPAAMKFESDPISVPLRSNGKVPLGIPTVLIVKMTRLPEAATVAPWGGGLTTTLSCTSDGAARSGPPIVSKE